MKHALAILAASALLLPHVASADIAIKDGQKIGFMGDSITAAGARPGGYCNLFVSMLAENGIKVTPVYKGISGHKSNQMLARLDKDILSQKPDWMTLSCGVNDVWHGKRGVELEDYKKNITEIVDKCQAAGTKVVILTSTMIKEDADNDLNKKLAAYNDFLRELAKEKNCLIADLNADMQEAVKNPPPGQPEGKTVTTDGVHMNIYGNMMMAKGVARAFGFNDEQLAAAEKSWRNLEGLVQVRPAPLKLSLAQQEKLNKVTAEKGTTLNDVLKDAQEKAIKELLGE